MTNSPITIAVCDGEPIAIEGLRVLFETVGGFQVLAAHNSLVAGAEAVSCLRPNVLLVDRVFGLHAVMDWLKVLRDSAQATRSVVWGVNISDVESLRLVQAGAAGVIRKTAPVQELIECLRRVGSGGTWLDSAIAQSRTFPRPGHSPLTARELQVMELVERGLKNKDIGGELGICTGTVKIHLKHIFEKTGIRGRYGLALNGLRGKGILAVPQAEAAA